MLILVSNVRSRPKDLVWILNVTEVVRLVGINPRGTRFVYGENVYGVFIPIIVIRLRSTKGINSTIKRIRKRYLSFASLLQPQDRTQNLVRSTKLQIAVIPLSS
jgi:hypothetical protein